MNGRQVARGLAWFGLGLAELLAPCAVARAAGVERHAGLVQAFGLREIASGVVLAASGPERALRVAGDGMDAALLASAMLLHNLRRLRAVLATQAVAPVVVLDALNARR